VRVQAPAPKKIFSWKPSDSVDVALLDRQHQALFEIAQQLYDALSRADGIAVAEDVFNRLMEYSANHFAAEERLMEKHEYPSLKTHRAEHRAFSNKLTEFKKNFKAGNASVLSDMLPYLQSWIKDHVQRSDHQYSEFLKAHGEK
jgi:hemerythrin